MGGSIPDNVQSFYNSVKKGECDHVVKKGFTDGNGGKNFKYCMDTSKGLVWIAGPDSLSDMDVDCDGAKNKGGKCSNDPSGQSETAFKDEVKKFGIEDLDANVHGYVVFGNEGGSPSFDPQSVGVEPLSVIVVVCGKKMYYGLWGDTNGGTSTGEASISMATACYGDKITGDNGHSEHDVLYLAFTGKDAKVGKDADWKAKNFEAFESSLKSLGEKLVKRI
ncbi:hypothetical protein RUND412_002097 [Rhizina undulata]